MLCGVGNFSYVDDDLPASPRKFHSRKPKKNPYSSRGLNKFSEVVAELKAKRERILKQVDAPGTTSVRFMYMDSNWIPIIVKKQLPKHGEEGNKKWDGKKGNTHGSSKCPSGPSVKVLEKGKVEKATSDMVVGRTRGGSKRGRLRFNRITRRWIHVPARAVRLPPPDAPSANPSRHPRNGARYRKPRQPVHALRTSRHGRSNFSIRRFISPSRAIKAPTRSFHEAPRKRTPLRVLLRRAI